MSAISTAFGGKADMAFALTCLLLTQSGHSRPDLSLVASFLQPHSGASRASVRFHQSSCWISGCDRFATTRIIRMLGRLCAHQASQFGPDLGDINGGG